MIDGELLALLACPRCRGPLDAREDELACAACALRFPVRDGVPVLLLEEALGAAPPEDEDAGAL